MDDVEKLLKGTVEELDRLLNAKNVLGAPIERDGATVIPLVSFGFGFGAGGSAGTEKSGAATGTGAGGGVKPVGAIIIDDHGARVEEVRGAVTTIADMVADAAAKAMARRRGDRTNDDAG